MFKAEDLALSFWMLFGVNLNHMIWCAFRFSLKKYIMFLPPNSLRLLLFPCHLRILLTSQASKFMKVKNEEICSPVQKCYAQLHGYGAHAPLKDLGQVQLPAGKLKTVFLWLCVAIHPQAAALADRLWAWDVFKEDVSGPSLQVKSPEHEHCGWNDCNWDLLLGRKWVMFMPNQSTWSASNCLFLPTPNVMCQDSRICTNFEDELSRDVLASGNAWRVIWFEDIVGDLAQILLAYCYLILSVQFPYQTGLYVKLHNRINVRSHFSSRRVRLIAVLWINVMICCVLSLWAYCFAVSHGVRAHRQFARAYRKSRFIKFSRNLPDVLHFHFLWDDRA